MGNFRNIVSNRHDRCTNLAQATWTGKSGDKTTHTEACKVAGAGEVDSPSAKPRALCGGSNVQVKKKSVGVWSLVFGNVAT